MEKQTWTWTTERLPEPARVARWGHFGTPVLLYPTAGGDYEEVERFGLIEAIAPLIESGRIKVFSVDSIAGRAWMRGTDSPEYRSRLQNSFDAYVYQEVVPQVRRDCHDERVELIVTGASIGAFNAVASICRHPDVFRTAIGMSGTYDLSKYLGGTFNEDFYFSSPLHYLPGLGDSPQLAKLRERFVLLATGEGDYEDPGESWRIADVLGSKGVRNRVELWGREYRHDWPTWRAMLPKYLGDYA